MTKKQKAKFYAGFMPYRLLVKSIYICTVLSTILSNSKFRVVIFNHRGGKGRLYLAIRDIIDGQSRVIMGGRGNIKRNGALIDDLGYTHNQAGNRAT